MDRRAWEAMNDFMALRPIGSHQSLSNGIVEALHVAGFVIVSHKLTNGMLEDAGSIAEYDVGLRDMDYRNWWEAVLFGPIEQRLESEQGEGGS